MTYLLAVRLCVVVGRVMLRTAALPARDGYRDVACEDVLGSLLPVP